MKKYCDVETIGLDILINSHVYSALNMKKMVYGSLLSIFMHVRMLKRTSIASGHLN
jgi:hypothetical protein